MRGTALKPGASEIVSKQYRGTKVAHETKLSPYPSFIFDTRFAGGGERFYNFEYILRIIEWLDHLHHVSISNMTKLGVNPIHQLPTSFLG